MSRAFLRRRHCRQFNGNCQTDAVVAAAAVLVICGLVSGGCCCCGGCCVPSVCGCSLHSSSGDTFHCVYEYSMQEQLQLMLLLLLSLSVVVKCSSPASDSAQYCACLPHFTGRWLKSLSFFVCTLHLANKQHRCDCCRTMPPPEICWRMTSRTLSLSFSPGIVRQI